MSKSIATFWIALVVALGYFGSDGVGQPDDVLLAIPISPSAAGVATRTFWTATAGAHQIEIRLPGCEPGQVTAIWRVVDINQAAIDGGTIDLGGAPCAKPQVTLGEFMSAKNRGYGVRVRFRGTLASLGEGDPMLIVR